MRYVLQNKVNGMYVRSRNFNLKYTDDIEEAYIYKTENSARLSANNGFKLSEHNGQQLFNVVKVKITRS